MSVAGQRTPQRGRGGYGRRGGPALDTAWRTVTPAPAVMLYGPEEYFASRAAARQLGTTDSVRQGLHGGTGRRARSGTGDERPGPGEG